MPTLQKSAIIYFPSELEKNIGRSWTRMVRTSQARETLSLGTGNARLRHIHQGTALPSTGATQPKISPILFLVSGLFLFLLALRRKKKRRRERDRVEGRGTARTSTQQKHCQMVHLVHAIDAKHKTRPLCIYLLEVCLSALTWHARESAKRGLSSSLVGRSEWGEVDGEWVRVK